MQGGGTALASALKPMQRLAAAVYELTLGAGDASVEPMQVALIAPMHGPCIKNSLTELVGRCARSFTGNGWSAHARPALL